MQEVSDKQQNVGEEIQSGKALDDRKLQLYVLPTSGSLQIIAKVKVLLKEASHPLTEILLSFNIW